MDTWIVILAAAAGTYALRLSMFVLVGRGGLPAWFDRPAALVAPAAIAALVATAVAVDGGQRIAPSTGYVAALVAGFVAVRRTGSVMHAFTVGLPVLWATQVIGLA